MSVLCLKTVLFWKLLTHEGAKRQQAGVHLAQKFALLCGVMRWVPLPKVQPGLPGRVLGSIGGRGRIVIDGVDRNCFVSRLSRCHFPNNTAPTAVARDLEWRLEAKIKAGVTLIAELSLRTYNMCSL